MKCFRNEGLLPAYLAIVFDFKEAGILRYKPSVMRKRSASPKGLTSVVFFYGN